MVDSVDVQARVYARLVAAAARLLPGLAEVPPCLARAVAAEPLPRPSSLVADVGRLRAELGDGPRARFLAAQARALECTARRLAGQDLPFAEEVADTFGVEVCSGAEDVYAAVHRAVADLLPGTGPLPARWLEHRRRDEVPASLLLPAARALSAALRDRVPWPLPTGEDVGYRVVTEALWTALHARRGGARSIVTLNVGARLGWTALPGLVAHEAYPGHHVQRCLQPRLPERAVVLVRSPQSVVAEGLAETGLDLLVGPDWGTWAADVLAAAGLPVGFDGGLAQALEEVTRPLRAVRQDAALLLHDRRLPPAARAQAARRHLERWLPLRPGRAERIVTALGSTLWRGYVVAHVQGPPMVNSWLRAGAESSLGRYRHLLHAAALPVDLRTDARSGVDADGAEWSSTPTQVATVG
jgi:hypothetical protein